MKTVIELAGEVDPVTKVLLARKEPQGMSHDVFIWFLESFAALVAAAERKRFYGQDKPAECAKSCPPKQVCDYCQVVAPAKAMVLAEREACAKVCDELHYAADAYGAQCAAAIRARGQACT
jgi:hypothetical protein